MRYSTMQVNIDLLLRRNQMETTSSFGAQNSMRCFLRHSVASTPLEILKGRHPIGWTSNKERLMCSLQCVARLRQRYLLPAQIVRRVVCSARFFKCRICSAHRLHLPPLLPCQIG